jgi:glycerophosphoryl diester phosphodiesterase
MNLELPRPAIFAHRGASASAPENTLAAFRLALSQPADGIELDVHLSADGIVVVIHDQNLNRTTNGVGLVHRTRLEELRRLDAGQGEAIPTLDEVLALVGDQVLLNVELKGFAQPGERLAAETIACVRSHGLSHSVLYSSFDVRHLLRIRQLEPDVALGLLLDRGWSGWLARTLFEPLIRPWSLHPHYTAVDDRFLARARRSNRPVIAYTVNRPEDLHQLFSLGIDGIFTDDVPSAVAVREQMR